VPSGSDDEAASPGCSAEEHSALAELIPLSTLADPGTLVALLSASVQDFDAEAMALTQPAGAVALSWVEADAECMMAIRPRNATNVTLAFSRFEASTFRSVRVYDGLSMAAPLIATLRDDGASQPVTSRSNAVLLVVQRDPDWHNAGGFTATYRADNSLELSGGAPTNSSAVSACVPPKRRMVCAGASIGSLACRCRVCFLLEAEDERIVGQPKPSRGRR